MPRVLLEEGSGLVNELVILGKSRQLVASKIEFQLVDDADRRELTGDLLTLQEWQDQTFLIDYLGR